MLVRQFLIQPLRMALLGVEFFSPIIPILVLLVLITLPINATIVIIVASCPKCALTLGQEQELVDQLEDKDRMVNPIFF